MKLCRRPETRLHKTRKSYDPPAKSGAFPVSEPGSFTRRVATAAMSNRFRPLTLIALALAGCGLSGCGTINGYLASGVSDYLPQWAGGLPPDAPPRPGTAKYDEFILERERKRLETAAPKDGAGTPSSASLEAVY
jgi:hypothetical protein